MSKPTVFISGATGFIAQHIIKQLLDSKTYKVVGSVRSAAKAEKLESDFGNHPDLSLVTVEDLSKLDAFDSVFKEHGASFDYIFHTASPVVFTITDFQNEMITPAVNGTKNIFEATVKYAPNVKKFVQTSSKVITEKSWNPMTLEEGLQNPSNAYLYSKTTGEKALWELHSSLHAKFPIVVINPTYVFGPQVFDSSVHKNLNASNEVINGIVHSKLKDSNLVSNTNASSIDVRDVARAHVDAITNDKLNGQRLLLDNERFSSQSVADIINNNFPELKGKIGLNFPAKLDNHVTREFLGFKFIDLETSVKDTVQQILKVEAAAK
ncbi:hypothetical protein ACO0RG_000114 [Hanseniaspora osmophila]